MREREKYWSWEWYGGRAEPGSMLRCLPLTTLLAGVGLLVGVGLLGAAGTSGVGEPCGRLAVRWSVDAGDHSYRLRGRYSITSLSGAWSTSVSSEAVADASRTDLCVPPGLYRVTLEPGHSLERSTSGGAGERSAWPGDDAQAVPAMLVSPNPVVVSAREERAGSMGLALVDLSEAAAEPEATCMSDS